MNGNHKECVTFHKLLQEKHKSLSSRAWCGLSTDPVAVRLAGSLQHPERSPDLQTPLPPAVMASRPPQHPPSDAPASLPAPSLDAPSWSCVRGLSLREVTALERSGGWRELVPTVRSPRQEEEGWTRVLGPREALGQKCRLTVFRPGVTAHPRGNTEVLSPKDTCLGALEPSRDSEILRSGERPRKTCGTQTAPRLGRSRADIGDAHQQLGPQEKRPVDWGAYTAHSSPFRAVSPEAGLLGVEMEDLSLHLHLVPGVSVTKFPLLRRRTRVSLVWGHPRELTLTWSPLQRFHLCIYPLLSSRELELGHRNSGTHNSARHRMNPLGVE